MNGYYAMQNSREEERRAQLAAEYDAAQQAEAEAIAQAEARERERLEALKGERLVFEEIDSMTKAERAHFEQADAQQAREFIAQAREQEETEYAEQLRQEKEALMIEWRNTHHNANTNQRSRAAQEIDAAIREKAQAWLQAREARELAAEEQPSELHRLVSSLGDRGKEILNGMIDSRPPVVERVRASKQASQVQRGEELKRQYIAEMAASKKAGFIPRHIANQIRDKYENLGLRTGSPDVVNDLMQAVGR